LKKHLTFGKLFVLTTAIFITLTITFGFSKLFASDNTNCKNCGSISYLNGGNGYSSSELNDMRNTIKKNDYKFTVANNPATKYELSQICGLKKEFQVNSSIPDNTITVDSSVQASLPSSYDLRSNGLTSIKNQNSCGSCWAFATAGVVENVLKLKASKTLDLSEQWLVSCNSDNYSCSGGWWVFDMYKSKGAVYESDMPYTNSNGNCKSNLTYHEKIDGWSFIGSSSSTP
jgi:C1A family cysteine protease